MAHVTLQDIFQAGFPDYERTHSLPWHVRRAARAIMYCRTAVLGGHVQSCPDGHVSRIWYNSCKHRSCPQCAFVQIERWLSTQKARLLGCDHSHVIFTIPHDLNAVWLANVPLMTSLVFAAVRDTLFALLGDPNYLGAQPGIMAALHTWGQTLVLHPHIHCLVTGGGLAPDGQWVAVRNGYLLPSRVVMAVFRGTLLDALRRAFPFTVASSSFLRRYAPSNFSTSSTALGIRKRRAGMCGLWNGILTARASPPIWPALCGVGRS